MTKLTHLDCFIQMLDSVRYVYRRYEHEDSIEIAISSIEGYHCFSFDKDGNFECMWDRKSDYADDLYD